MNCDLHKPCYKFPSLNNLMSTMLNPLDTFVLYCSLFSVEMCVNKFSVMSENPFTALSPLHERTIDRLLFWLSFKQALATTLAL